MNVFYLRFIENGKSLAELQGLLWYLPVDDVGKVSKAARWPRALTGALARPIKASGPSQR